jgi:hypothetical protein
VLIFVSTLVAFRDQWGQFEGDSEVALALNQRTSGLRSRLSVGELLLVICKTVVDDLFGQK